MHRRKFIKNTIMAAGLAVVYPKSIWGKSGGGSVRYANNVLKPDPACWNNNTITIAWIGHSTVLMNIFGKIILTDPVLFEKIGIYVWGTTIGQSRYSPPALSFDEIPQPDVVLLSHAHMDHTDYKSLKALTEKYAGKIDCITAYNTSDVAGDLKWKSIKEMDWNDEHTLPGFSFKALRVKHFGWRYPWEKDRSKGFMKDGRSFNAYLIERNGKTILFGGDTALQDYFGKDIGRKADIAIMPVGAYNPWRFNHCSPDEALKMAKTAGAGVFIPIHCCTFKQGLEPADEPIKLVKKYAVEFDMNIGIEELGGTFTLI